MERTPRRPRKRVNPTSPSPLPKRLLIRGVNWLGDAIMSLPAIQRIREAHPHWHITLLTRDSLSGLWNDQPVLNQVITFTHADRPWSIAQRLRPEHFDIALAFPNSTRAALELFLARIPRRVGFGGRLRSLFLTRVVPRRPNALPMRKRSPREIQKLIAQSPSPPSPPFPREAHHTYDYLELARALGANPAPIAPSLHVTTAATNAFRQKWNIPPATILLGLNPGAEYGPAKRWPADRFIEAAVQIHRQTQCLWLIFGARADQPLAAQIEQGITRALPGPPSTHAPVLNLAGSTTLSELCAGLHLCQALLTNDTGPMHVAAAVGCPVVVPFGSTSPELTGPGLPGSSTHKLLRSHPPCSPCFLRDCPIDFRCMTQISPQAVASAVLHILNPPT